MDTLSWQLPLLLAPIVGLLLISTSTRHQQIHREIHHLLTGEAELPNEQLRQLRRRVTLFRNALVALYVSVSLLALGSLLGMILTLFDWLSVFAIVIFSSMGIDQTTTYLSHIDDASICFDSAIGSESH